jgi:hypothetical protein
VVVLYEIVFQREEAFAKAATSILAGTLLETHFNGVFQHFLTPNDSCHRVSSQDNAGYSINIQ